MRTQPVSWLAQHRLCWHQGHTDQVLRGEGKSKTLQQGHIMTNAQLSGLSTHRSMLAARPHWLLCALET